MCDRRPKILVVDDDDNMLHLLQSYLSQTDTPVTVVTAHDASEANQVMQETPDIAGMLLDINLANGTSGEEYATQLRERGESIGIALMSGQRVHTGKFRYLPKPLDREGLLGTVRDMVSIWSIRQDTAEMRGHVSLLLNTFKGAGYVPA